jgi:hypothetical protein
MISAVNTSITINMKKLLLIAGFLPFVISCKKLTENPKAFVVEEQFYKTQGDAVASVNAVYASLTVDPNDQGLYSRNLYFLSDMGSDYAIAGPSAINPNVRSISSLTYTSTNDRVLAAWRQLYKGITRANSSIDHIPSISFDETLRNRLVNESKFLRALFYFNAVRLWGGVPLVLHESVSADLNAFKVQRSTAEEVYTQIIQDLTDADALPATYTGADIGRATGGAAKALLAKVYLTRKEWDKAVTKANEVINGPYGYDLFENFGDIFNKATKNGKEHIFSAQFEANTQPSGSGSIFMQAAFAGFTGNVPADIPADSALYLSYQPDDTRRDISFYTSLINPATGLSYTFPAPYFGKFVDRSILTTVAQVAINFPIIRYAEVLLILAEATNEDQGPTSEAYEAINQVRRRAFGKNNKVPDISTDLSGLSKDEFREAIYQERLFEFVQEGQRWFDLVRWGTLVSEVQKVASKSAVSERNNLYPIPQSEISINPEGLPQNTGY